MKNLLIAFLCAICGVCWGQQSDAEKYLKTLSEDYKTHNTQLVEATKILDELKSKVIPTNSDPAVLLEVGEQMQKTRKIQIKLDSINYAAQAAITHYVIKEKLDLEQLKAFFPHEHQVSTPEIPNKENRKIFYYFGPTKVIAEDDPIFNNKLANDVFEEVLSTDSQTYLGDFTIPRKNQSIKVYREVNKESTGGKENSSSQNNASIKDIPGPRNRFIETNMRLKFQKIRLHLFEGSINDIQIYLTDDANNTYFYENKHPISLLRYTTLGSRNYIFLKLANSTNIDSTLTLPYDYKLDDLRIKLSDVLTYLPNPGDNYVPENLTIELPTKSEEDIHAHQDITYKVRQNTSLQNIVELRTYTDFLGLFGDAPNGIIQLEGKADFFINPTNSRNLYWFKKITPFVNFSKIEEEVRYVTVIPFESGLFEVNNPLEILEKAYLRMGVNISVASIRFGKEVPFNVSLYFPAVYQISDVMLPENVKVPYKSLGLGGGLLFDFKRFNNFGFNYSAELTNYNSMEFNTHPSIESTPTFLVFKNEAEIYYYPGENQHQAIFLRLKTFNNSGHGKREAFYQLQFGYRFSVGVNKRR